MALAHRLLEPHSRPSHQNNSSAPCSSRSPRAWVKASMPVCEAGSWVSHGGQSTRGDHLSGHAQVATDATYGVLRVDAFLNGGLPVVDDLRLAKRGTRSRSALPATSAAIAAADRNKAGAAIHARRIKLLNGSPSTVRLNSAAAASPGQAQGLGQRALRRWSIDHCADSAGNVAVQPRQLAKASQARLCERVLQTLGCSQPWKKALNTAATASAPGSSSRCR